MTNAASSSASGVGVLVGGDGCGIAVACGRLVGSGVRVGVGVLTGVAVGVCVGLGVAVDVCVGSSVAVGVSVGRDVGVFVGFDVAVGNGVLLGLGVLVGGFGVLVCSSSVASAMAVVEVSEVQAIKVAVRPSNRIRISGIEKCFVEGFTGFLLEIKGND